jgi:hypothetical protein
VKTFLKELLKLNTESLKQRKIALSNPYGVCAAWAGSESRRPT